MPSNSSVHTQAGATPAQSPRDLINRLRRRRALWQAAALLTVGIGTVYFIHSGHYAGLAYWPAVIAIAIIVTAFSRQPCPRCRNDLSRLPDEGHLTFPELSHAICACPYCGLDLSPPSSSITLVPPPSLQSPAPIAASVCTARDAINAHRRRVRVMNWIGTLVAAGLFFLIAELANPSRGSIAATIVPVILMFHVIMHSIRSGDRCPRCHGDIEMLPNEKRSLRWPLRWRCRELSHAIHFCPYCRADFSPPQNPAS